MNLSKITSRKFAVPSTAMLLGLTNETMGLGIDWKITVAIIITSGIYALAEAMVDVAKIKALAVEKKLAK